MQSDCVFTTSPTPSPTHPLSVPYTSPTSPTNVQCFHTFCKWGPWWPPRANVVVSAPPTAHAPSQQCITIAFESVPSEKTSPPFSPHCIPRTPIDAKLVAS